MTANIGTIDRILRFVLGVVLIAAPFVGNLAFFQSTLATVITVVVGIVLVATSAMKFCPMYRVLGMNTCKI